MGYAEQVGFDTIIERGRLVADDLPHDMVYAGFSLGVLPAQMLAQTRPGAKGALLFHARIPPSEFGGAWPQGLPASPAPPKVLDHPSAPGCVLSLIADAVH